jgi:hypothetical protein
MHGGKYKGWPAEMAKFFEKQRMQQRFDTKSRAKLECIYSKATTEGINVPTKTTMTESQAPK